MTRVLPFALSAAALLTFSTGANAQDRWHSGDHDWHHGDGGWDHHGDRDHHWRGGWGGGYGGWGYRGGSYVSIGVYPYGYGYGDGYGYGGYFPGYPSYGYPIYSYPGYPTGYLRWEYGGRNDWDRRRHWRRHCDRNGGWRC
jgi:hypothetical protein